MAIMSLLISVLVCNIFLLVAQQATAQPSRFVYRSCQNSKGNYTLNSTYQANLNRLLTTLPTSQNDNGYGFYNLSYGKGSDQVYAVGLCRGDITPDFCRSCLNNSTQLLKDICPNQKEALCVYEHCMLRYSNRSLLGSPEITPSYALFNNKNVSSSNVKEHFDNLSTLLDGLKSEAASGGYLRKYAAGNAKAPGFLTIYALVQCTPDLSEQQCINCLNIVYGQIPRCCSGKVGARIIVPSCSVRYEKYLFYSSDKTRNIIIAVVATLSAVVLIIFLAVCLRLRKSKNKVQVKSDVFNFGVLILEIVSGQKNSSFRQGEYVEDLLSYTWRIWREGNTSKMVDPLMRVGSASDVMRCIHIGLLSVQENIENRPTMNAIVLMLNSNSLSLPLPSEPAFFMRNNTKSSNHSKGESINEASICSIFMVVAQQATAENYYCIDKGNYTLNSTYHDNLNHLLSTLPNSQNNNGYGFYNLSYGNADDQVFAMALCDGDAMPDSCQRCLNESTHLVQQLCPYQKEVVLWHNNCMLRYSNRSLFGFMESFPRVILYNTQNASSDPDTVEAYFKDLRSLLDNLKSRAMAGGSLKKFALDSIKSAGFKTIYGLVQCSPDLSKIDCNNCLDDSFGNLPGCCNLKKGGVVLGTSCRHRYEDYLFYDISNVTQAPPPSPMPQPLPPPPLTVPEHNQSYFLFIIIILYHIYCCIINYSIIAGRKKESSATTWRHWREGNATKIIDPVMRGRRGSEIMRCIHIGLLCVQTNLVDRPTMNNIVLMLNSNSVSLPVPSQPAFYMHSNTGGVNHNQLPQRESVNEASITEISPR
ncbi:hypothetical protein G4B88_019769 [Cannabis sativa]|uniref:Gnk2-homologous domain-containing protein n=1 Tax=Cannabis sativa TaxID=3483 RepID=A0A7J6HTQ9_CANSA|nr:hypothetical protein G4B88_019769 [Cannabis sativa]